jgi:hypothetical protein
MCDSAELVELCSNVGTVEAVEVIYDQEAGAELVEVEVVKVARAKIPSAEADKAGAVADDVDVFVVRDAEMVGADARGPDEEAVGDLAAVREG